MSTLAINGQPFAAGLYWLERAGPAATARAARRFARPWCVHRAGQTGYAGGTENDAPEGLPALAPALVDSIESEFWMALVAGDAATGDSTDRGDTGRYALIKVRDGAVLADGDEVFTGRDAAVEAFGRARTLGWDLYATPGLLAGGADREVTDLDVSSLTAAPENVLRRAPFTRIGRAHLALVLLLPAIFAGGSAAWLQRDTLLDWISGGPEPVTAIAPPAEPELAVAVDSAALIEACRRALSDTAFGGPLPSGRAALAGTVRDPYTHTNERVSRERQLEDCAADEYGQGRTRVREVTQTHDERGNPVGDPVHGPWQLLIDECRADYTAWENYTLVCHWNAGPPHNRRMEGREIWRRLKSVTAEGETLGPPEFVSTSCWTGKVPVPPTAVVTEIAQTEAMTDGCPSGYTGSQEYRRTVTHRATQFPWDAEPIVQINYGPWILETDSCEAVIPPDWGGDGNAGGGEPAVGGFGGAGGPGGDSCSPPLDPDAGTDVCSVDSSIGFDTSGFGGGGGGGGGGCFLTTAIVERRGIEADDGPTLTALRRFRDGYMMKTPKRRALVAEYYEIAPRIAAAIPQGHSDWDWIGGRIDAAIAAIYAGDEDGAFGIYAAMVRRLAACWTEPDGRMAAGANTTKGT